MANVPIVTDVTKAELDALVSANGLEEGLQYKVTDKNWLLTATSNNSYIFNESIPCKKYIAVINNGSTTGLVISILENTIGDIVWTIEDSVVLRGTLSGKFTPNKTFWIQSYSGSPNSFYGSDDSFPDSIWFSDQISQWFNLLIEIRVYY